MIEDEIKDVGRNHNLMGNEWLPDFLDCNPTAKIYRYIDASIHNWMVKKKIASGSYIFSYILEVASQDATVVCMGV